jgi:hypothetical protein
LGIALLRRKVRVQVDTPLLHLVAASQAHPQIMLILYDFFSRVPESILFYRCNSQSHLLTLYYLEMGPCNEVGPSSLRSTGSISS